MSVQSEIERISSNVASTYSNLEDMGADMPAEQNTNNLPETVLTIKAVRYDEQTLTDEQKAQARENIDATGIYVGSGDMPDGYNIQIDPDGEESDIVTREEFSQLEEQIAGFKQTVIDEISDEVNTEEYKQSVAEKVPFLKTAEQPTIVGSIEEMMDTSKTYVLASDGYFYQYEEVESENYNLFKISEVTFQSRLQNDVEGIISSNTANTANAVTGWIPVEYDKYYTFSALDDGERRTCDPVSLSAYATRINVKKSDGTILVNQYSTLVANAGITSSWSTLHANIEGIVAIQVQINISAKDISSAEKLKAFEPMYVEGNTKEEAYNNALTLDYLDGDSNAETSAIWRNTGLAYNQPVDYEDRVIKLESDVLMLKDKVEDIDVPNLDSVNVVKNVYDSNVIPNERFIRAIANFRDSEKAKDFQIAITNNSGKTIKNASIVVGLHNTVGVNPSNNNLPFQVYDEVFSEPIGFKFYDGNTELPYYIESESDCNYIVDKNVKTDKKTMGVIGGSVEHYNLLKMNECTHSYRLQDASVEMISSTSANIVTGVIPVKYGKYYTFSREMDGERVTYGEASTKRMCNRINVHLSDGSVMYGYRDLLSVGVTSDSTICINEENIVGIQVQINFGADISTKELLASHKVMVTEADTLEESLDRAINSEYISGDEEVVTGNKLIVYNATVSRMQISSDDGVTWTNICNEITSIPYRILLPDSQGNLFVASNDGYKLYKYTSSDGYMTGTQVIDMESYGTKIGSILEEDSDGNLYLGTYQTEWRCTIRKSTDHGDTWTIVFDTTECQHVHNIFINKKVTPNEIFIGLDNVSGSVRTYVSKDGGATWTLLDVPYRNNDNAFRYAGENFYIGCGERNILGGVSLYKTSDYNNPNAYYTLFDNCQGIRDVTNVIENSDDVLIAGGCVDDAVRTQHLFLSEDRGESWKTVLVNPHYANENFAGIGLRTFSRNDGQILSETSTGYAMRFVYGNGAKTILAVVNIGDVPTNGKTITLKTGYVANIEQMEKVLTSYEYIDGKVADIRICDGCVIDAVSNKRVLTEDTELSNSNIRIGQTSEIKILENHAYKLNGSVNLGKLSRLNFKKGFTVSLLFKKEDGKNYLEDDKYHMIFQTGDTKLILWYRSLILISGDTNIFAKKLYLEDAYLNSPWDAYLRVTAYFTDDDLPLAGIYTNNTNNYKDIACTEYPIIENLSDNDFIVGSSDMPNIARIEIFNRVLSHGEIMSLTNGCNLITDGSTFN